MNGNSASSAGPSAVEDGAGQSVEHPPQQRHQQRSGSTSSIASGAVVAAELGAARGRRRRAVIRGVHAASSSSASTSARNALSMSSVPVLLADPVGGVVGDDRALAHQQQPVAALGLVHHVAGDEDRRAAVGELGGTAPTGRGGAPGRGRRSARRGRAGRARRAARPRGWTRERWPPREPADHLVGVLDQVDRLDGSCVDPLGARRRAPGRRSARFSATVRSSYTLGGLGDVADPVAQRRAARPARRTP